MTKIYYNENDPYAAGWLRGLIAGGALPPGDVDDRSIVEVKASDLVEYDRCHFFAGIGGWELALRYAAWPPDRLVWTGSCPCQPFSDAGRKKGTDDERHLWPEFYRLIAEWDWIHRTNPQRQALTILGEQVASKDGRAWIDGVFADLEALDYACAAADLCAAGINAPHARQRLYWVADACSSGVREPQPRRDRGTSTAAGSNGPQWERVWVDAGDDGGLLPLPRGMAVPIGRRWVEAGHREQVSDREAIPRGQAEGDLHPVAPAQRLGDAEREGLEGQSRHELHDAEPGRNGAGAYRPSPAASWLDFVVCRGSEPTKEPGRYVDKRRRIEPGLVPLAYGVSGRMVVSRAGILPLPQDKEKTNQEELSHASRKGLLRGYGNAIMPPLAAEFVESFLEAEAENR